MDGQTLVNIELLRKHGDGGTCVFHHLRNPLGWSKLEDVASSSLESRPAAQGLDILFKLDCWGQAIPSDFRERVGDQRKWKSNKEKTPLFTRKNGCWAKNGIIVVYYVKTLINRSCDPVVLIVLRRLRYWFFSLAIVFMFSILIINGLRTSLFFPFLEGSDDYMVAVNLNEANGVTFGQ